MVNEQPRLASVPDEAMEAVERRNHWFRLAVELGQPDDFMALLAAERQLAAEQIALALEAVPDTVYPEDIFLPDGTSVDAQTARVMRFAYPAAARIARDVGAQEVTS